ncbi:MAG: hypothetical protein LBE23_05815 [Vagococcus sp.]|jgi:hypothetical protein|nr:hypothetical protein [Vagococcus sp.]
MKSDDFSPDMLLAYIGLRMIVLKSKNEYYVSTGLLSYSIFGKQVVNQLITKSIVNGTKQLIDKDIIVHVDIDEKGRSNEYILDLKNIQIDEVRSKDEEDFYSTIELDDVKKILESSLREKIDLFYFYCYLCTTVMKTGEKAGVGFTFYNSMENAIHISRQTISKYMNLLESMKIIYIYRANDSIVRDGKISEIPNVYGVYEIKDKIISVGSTYANTYGENAKRIKSTKQSSSRSASAKYKIIVNDLLTTGEVRYGKEELNEIYKTLIKHNKRYEYDEKLQKDLSIFDSLL